MKAFPLDDIIAAVSTPLGNGGIGIVRVSGQDCINLVSEIFKGAGLTEKASHTISFGHIIDPFNETVADEVLVSVMRGPKTYTRDDVVEINCHGGAAACKKVLEIILSKGARPAEPGEFTKRAFLNGRIDLSQAEAVIDIINSKTDMGRQSAVNQLEGGLKNTVYEIRDNLLTAIATIEAAIDYPEHDIEEETSQSLKNKITDIITRTDKLLNSSNKGKIIRDGISAVILGRPNVGKSSLLNYLLEEERAIVTDIPGTTRDTVEEYINIGGVAVKIIDTAGIRETEDTVERLGVEKSKNRAQNADLLLVMLDNSQALTSDDREILEMAQNKKSIVLLNKTDLIPVIETDEISKMVGEENIILLSVKEGSGIEKLTDRIHKMFLGGEINFTDDVMVTNLRHEKALKQAKESLEKAVQAIEAGMPIDFVSIDLMESYTHYGEITGDSVDEALLDKIFSEFCLGK